MFDAQFSVKTPGNETESPTPHSMQRSHKQSPDETPQLKLESTVLIDDGFDQMRRVKEKQAKF